jgi:alginate O-acetyltransferase complex protein AlgI
MAAFALSLSPWEQMWSIALALFGAMKLLTWAVCRPLAAPAWKHVAYLLAWPGMDAEAFLSRRETAQPKLGEWLFAGGKILLGVFLLVVVCPAVSEQGTIAAVWISMVGIVFVLHFGAFHLLSCLWRALAIDARPIMNWPLAASSLADFWGRRWNRAFRDLTDRFVFHPLVRRIGPPRALLAGFLISGLVHDLVISIPAGGGYGLPTLYFAIQGGAVLAQRARSGSRQPRSNLAARLVTATVLLAPCPLLFHAWFVRGVMLPFVQSLGAL